MDELPPGRRRGRPRDEASRQAILHAASDLLEERGYLQLTIEEIAAAAGVGKPTIYRWWPSKAELVIEAYLSRADARLSMPDSGRLDADLREYTLTFCRVLMETNTARAVIGLAAAACDDPTVAMAFRERFIKTRRDVVRALLERGTAGGQLPAAIDLERALDLYFGPIWYRVIFRGAPVDAGFAERHAAEVLAWMRQTRHGTP
jgi:AcrR family transcriptional regulator